MRAYLNEANGTVEIYHGEPDEVISKAAYDRRMEREALKARIAELDKEDAEEAAGIQHTEPAPEAYAAPTYEAPVDAVPETPSMPAAEVRARLGL